MLLLSPLEQFQIISLYSIKLGKLDFSITNALLISLITLLCFSSIIYFASSNKNSTTICWHLLLSSIVSFLFLIFIYENNNIGIDVFFQFFGLIIKREYHRSCPNYSEDPGDIFSSDLDKTEETPIDSFEQEGNIPDADSEDIDTTINELSKKSIGDDKSTLDGILESSDSTKFQTSEELLDSNKKPRADEPENVHYTAVTSTTFEYNTKAAAGAAAAIGAMASGVDPDLAITGATAAGAAAEISNTIQSGKLEGKSLPIKVSPSIQTSSGPTDEPVQEITTSIPETSGHGGFAGGRYTTSKTVKVVMPAAEAAARFNGRVVGPAVVKVASEAGKIALRGSVVGVAVATAVGVHQAVQLNSESNTTSSPSSPDTTSSKTQESLSSNESTPKHSSEKQSASSPESNKSTGTSSTGSVRRALEDLD